MPSIITIDPFRCRMWGLHDRLDHYIDEQTCRVEIESVSKHGQLVPALGRPLRGDPTHEIELIYGARRLFIAQHLKRDLLVELREISDSEGIIAMDIENRHRVDISPYERGRSYLKWLRSGYFKSQDELARSLHISSSQVSRLIKLATLPAAVVAAFRSPTEICESWALELSTILDDPARHHATCAKGRNLSTLATKPAGREVFRQLLAASAPGRKIKAKTHDEIVKDTQNKPLFRVRHYSSSVALILPTNRISARSLEAIRSTVAQLMQQASA